jgi:hypothetical protein
MTQIEDERSIRQSFHNAYRFFFDHVPANNKRLIIQIPLDKAALL